MRKFVLWLCVAIAAVVPAMAMRYTGARPDSLLDALVFGVALISVLPEYAVDIYYALPRGPVAAVQLRALRRRGLAPLNAVEISFLLLPSLYAYIALAAALAIRDRRRLRDVLRAAVP